jgi:hypothetical protein
MCLLNTAVELLIALELQTTTDTESYLYIASIMSTHTTRRSLPTKVCASSSSPLCETRTTQSSVSSRIGPCPRTRRANC